MKAVEQLAEHPDSGRVVPEFEAPGIQIHQPQPSNPGIEAVAVSLRFDGVAGQKTVDAQIGVTGYGGEQPIADAGPGDLRVEGDPVLAPAWADAGQLEQAIMNLALNAQDAMPDGGRLTLALAHRPASGEPGVPKISTIANSEIRGDHIGNSSVVPASNGRARDLQFGE